MTSVPGDLPYDEVADQTWVAAFVGTAKRTERDEAVEFTGTCPHCGHQSHMRVLIRRRPTLFGALKGAKKLAKPSFEGKRLIRCECKFVHDGCPPDRKGCGRFGNIVRGHGG